jgi:hypothetical protein
MTKRGEQAPPERKAPPVRWRGDAVEDRPGDEAERAAERAEGNAPVPMRAERDRIEEPPDPAQQPHRVHVTRRRADDPDEETAATAEEHQERRDAGERPPRGKL